MRIRIIPKDPLEKSEKNPAEMIPPLLFPRLKNLYSRRAARLRDLAAKILWVTIYALPPSSPRRRKSFCTIILCR